MENFYSDTVYNKGGYSLRWCFGLMGRCRAGGSDHVLPTGRRNRFQVKLTASMRLHVSGALQSAAPTNYHPAP